MSGGTTSERAALAQVLEADRDEQNRGFIWSLLSLKEKRAAMRAAGLGDIYATYRLDQFTAEQRFNVVAVLQQQVQHLQMMMTALGVGVIEAQQRKAKQDAARLAELEAWALEAHPSRGLPH